MDDPVHEACGPFLFVKREMQKLEMVKERPADIKDRALSDIVGQVFMAESHADPENLQDKEGANQSGKQSHVPARNRLVNNQLDE